MHKGRALTAVLAAAATLLIATNSANAFVCTPMSSTQAAIKFATKWQLAVGSQTVANNVHHFSIITLNANGAITVASGDGLPITGNIKIAANCKVTGSITANFGSTQTYALTGVAIESSNANLPSSLQLRAKPAAGQSTLFWLVQTP